MTVKRVDPKKQIFFIQQAAGEEKAHDMTVSLSRDGQNQVYSLPGCLVFFQFPTMPSVTGWES